MSDNRFSFGKLILLVVLLAAGIQGYKFIKEPVKAPDTEFRLVDNRLISTADLQGKVVALNFWSTGCPPCVREMPMLARVYNNYKTQGFELLAIALNSDDARKVAQFARANALPFNVAYDANGRAAQAWGPIRVIPTTFILDRKGRVVEVFNQALSYDQLSSVIQKYL